MNLAGQNMKQTLKKSGLIVAGVAGILGAIYSFSFTTDTVRASAGDNVSGYAWSDTGGWISFNSTDTGVGNYGVTIDASGNFSGYAWSDIVGWISFNASDVTASSSCGSVAKLDTATNKVSGWARVVSGITGAGNGKGCIKLSDSVAPAYGVTYNPVTHKFEGYAWEPDVLGWISFNCSDDSSCGTSNHAVAYVPANLPPTVVLNTPDDVSSTIDTTPTLDFTGTDSDSDTLEYNVQIDTLDTFNSQGALPLLSKSSATPDAGFTAGHPFASGAAKDYTVQAGDALVPGTTYYWRVRGLDPTGTNIYGAWSTTRSFSVVSTPSPTLSFSVTPTTIPENTTAQLDWSTANVNPGGTCTASANPATGAWSGTKSAAGGTQSTGNLAADQTYSLECWNSGGVSTGVSSTTVHVVPSGQPDVTFFSTPSSEVTFNGSITLGWNPINIDSGGICTATGDWSGNKTNVGGSEGIGPLTSNKTYNLQCWNSLNVPTQVKTVTITVLPATCGDTIDNDADGYCDGLNSTCTDGSTHGDPDCYNGTTYDPNLSESGNNKVCSDGLPNPNGLTDAADPGCHTDYDPTNQLSYNRFIDPMNTCNVITDIPNNKKKCDNGETFGSCPVDCADQFKYIEF